MAGTLPLSPLHLIASPSSSGSYSQVLRKIATLTPEQKEALRVQLTVDLVKRYATLVRTGLPENQHFILDWGKALFPEKFTLPFCHEMHDYFCRHRDTAFTSDEAPRGHAKTSIKCFLIPMFQALEEPWKYQHYLNVQSTEDKALSINSSLMVEFMENKILRAAYGNQVTAQKWTNGQFVLKNGVIFTAVGAGQSIRGLNYRQVRPDYILVDDLYDEDDIHNTDSTKKKNRWFWGSLYPARAKGKRNCIKIQGTAINECDLMFLARTSKRIISKCFKAVKDFDLKVVLWPEHNTFETLMDDREDMGSLIFFREYQNDRIDDSTSKIKRSWLANWEQDPASLIFDRHTQLITVKLGNDPSIGKKFENDFSAYAVVIKWRPADGSRINFFIDYLFQARMTLDERVKKLQYIAAMYGGMSRGAGSQRRIRSVCIEGISGFQDYVAEVKRRTNLPVKEINHVKDKIAVLEDKSKFFEFGNVRINRNIPVELKDLLLHQLTTNYPEFDDLRDALFLAIDDTKSWKDWI